MNGSRLNPNLRGERSSLDALNRTIEGLEARIEDLLKTSASRDPRAAELRQRVEAPMSERRLPERRRAVEQDTLQEIRQRQRMLEAARERRTDMAERPLRSDMLAEPQMFAERGRATDARPPYADAPARHAARTHPAADAGIGSVAEALNELRRELRHDISENIAREMQVLRADVQSMQGLANGKRLDDDLRDELARLADSVDAVSRRMPEAAENLRADLDALRGLIDDMASRTDAEPAERRWTLLEARLDELDAAGIRKELIALAYRIDGVKAELGVMADSPAIRALEDKMMMLAAAVEDLSARPQDSEQVAGHLSHIDMRLDEITRAVAINNNRSRNEAAEHQALRILEERLVDLNDKIDGLSRMQDAFRLEERLEELAEVFARQPQQELTGTLSDLARKIDALSETRNADTLAERLDRLTRRLDEFDGFAPAATEPGLERLESRLDAIATRLDEASRAPRDDQQALRNLEAQITHLSGLLNGQRPDAGLSPELDQRMAAIENYMATSDEYVLEAARQAAESVAEAYARSGQPASNREPSGEQATLLALAGDLRQLEELARGSEERAQETFSGLHRTLVQIAERLDKMEDRLSERPLFGAGSLPRERQDATAHRPPMAVRDPVEADEAPRGLLARVAEQLNAETAAGTDLLTPDAGHDPERNDEPPRKGLLAKLSDRLRPPARARDQEAVRPPERTLVDPAPTLDPVEAIAADTEETELLEPGSGVPDVRKILERVRAAQAASASTGPSEVGEDGERIDYIAAARRAARAAVQEVNPAAADLSARAGRKQASSTQRGLKAALARHRRPILMAIGAVLLALMAVPLAGTLTRGEKVQRPIPATTAPTTAPAAAKPVAALVKPAETTPETTAQTAPAMPSPTEAAASTAAPAATQANAPPAPQASLAAAPAAGDGIAVPPGIRPQPLADAAAAGNPQALFEVATRFSEGHGVAADAQEAARWYRMAADRGYPPAQYRLGSLYEKGNGVVRDLGQARLLYEAAAKAGHAGAMHNLAVLYASGATGSVDYTTAVRWFAEAAEHGVADSQFNLAILYARGNGTAQNLADSYMWFSIAAAGGDSDAAAKRDDVARALKPAELDAARQKATSWQPQPLDARANGTNMPQDWVEKGNGSASIDMDKAIRNIQAILNRSGYDAGQPDGLMGRKTLAAIKAFQRQNGLPDDGNISEALVRKLLAQNEARGA
ncbi:peptidoglycan-binding protein [Rhizobium straminoryzae]|uniref:Hemagglutinin n=1 Tax=Rhizobium straminoryzae TaxID=1387186 RepID=A0A549TI72_9HYPH|nr:peptidoglycan-binding protein [Rhizobium straminoryzae]TRL42943.1 hemagglutinin [Rhizobium straminoryzae]